MSQQLVMTPQLQQAIKLLQLSRLELIDQIREELTENPILDEASGEDPRASDADGEIRSIDDVAAADAQRDHATQSMEEKRAVSETQEVEYWERFLESYSNQQPMPSGAQRLSSEDMPSLEQTLSNRSSLSDHLMAQLRLTPLSDEELAFATFIVHNLDEHGYLRLLGVSSEKPKAPKKKPAPVTDRWGVLVEPLEDEPDEDEAQGRRKKKKVDEHETELTASEIADNEESKGQTVTLDDIARWAGLDPEDAEEVLRLIQTLDPVGVAARDLRECLLIQAEEFGYDDENVVWKVIDQHLPNLERRNFNAIVRDLRCDLEDVYDAAKLISTLEPRPGRNFTTEDTPYVTPDVYVIKSGDDYVVTTNDDGLPKLKINAEQALSLMRQINEDDAVDRSVKSAVKKVLEESDPKAPALTDDQLMAQLQRNGSGADARAVARARASVENLAFVQNKLASARWFVRSLDQRQRTIVKVTQCIVERQREFFELGIEHLKPMILRDVAEIVGMHESTISRVTTNKYVHTPRGTFELKYFFNSSIRRMADEDIASESVKQAIKKIISEEDPKSPLSDEAIARTLEEQSKIMIARRTIAKYREMLGILSSAKRKQYY
ncbi:MAG: RNA polymerase sigma-54 factor [Deltaproteobacteria bacterium]|nr:RNA polymerase sigma-54 factor [Deltaproteobacteria bacterium]